MTRAPLGQKMQYDRCCVDCNDCVEDLDTMIESATDITYRTMLRHCEGLLKWAESRGYDRHLRLQNDWHVSFHKSTFQGQPCYFLQWSGIEYIWTPQGNGLIEESYGVVEGVT